MATSTKPRKRYRPRPIAANAISLAIRRASKVPADEIETVMHQVTASFTAMREGVGTEQQWQILAGTVELALSIEHQGVIRGLRGHLTAAEAALAGIKHRAIDGAAWKATPLYWQEIEALDTFVWLHRRQLEALSEGEWQRAYDRAVGLVLSAGGQAVDVRELQDVQLPLLAGGKENS